MLLVKTKLGLSKISGIGLYADTFIPKGTIIWRFVPKLDLKFNEKEYQAFKRKHDCERIDNIYTKAELVAVIYCVRTMPDLLITPMSLIP
jgi:hypothetical protein